jgi:hypothetical protein
MTGLAEPEFTALLPHFARALAAYLQHRTIDGQPRTSRRYRAYDHGPLPTVADKRLFMLPSVAQHPMPEVQGPLCGMSQAHAHTWMHGLPPGLNQTLADPDLRPARTAAAFAAMVETHTAGGSSTTPLCGMLALNGRSTARPIPKRQKHMTAVSRSVTRAKTSW